jgi:hypothetical protein
VIFVPPPSHPIIHNTHNFLKQLHPKRERMVRRFLPEVTRRSTSIHRATEKHAVHGAGPNI